MDKLRHIDELLKESLGQSVDTGVYTSDWLAIEKRLKRRKNRIYAMWFSLSLILLTSVSLFFIDLNTNNSSLTDNNQDKLTEPIKNNSEIANPNVENQQINNADMQLAEVDQNSALPIEIPIDNSTSPTTTNNTPNTDIQLDVNTEQDAITLDPQPAEMPLRIADLGYLTSLNSIYFDYYFENGLDALNIDYLSFANHSKKSLFSSSHIEMGVSFTPSIANKWTSERAELGGLINRKYNNIANSESASFASSTSFNLEFHFNSHFFIGTGFGITQRTEAVNYDFTIDEFPEVDEVNNQITAYTPIHPNFQEEINYSGSNSYHFIEVPLTIGYAANIGRKFQFRNQIDLSYMLLFNKIGQKADYTYLTLNDLSTVDYLNNSNLSSTFKSGVYYKFKNFVIGAEPTVSMNLNSLSDNSSAIKIKPYYYGFNLTTNILLNRK